MGALAASARIVVVGSLNADLTTYCERLPLPGETVAGYGFAVLPGGKSANQAVAAARLGGAVTLIGAVGNDSHGQMLLASAADAGVDVSQVRTSDAAATGVAVIAVDAQGENTIIVSPGANGSLAPADVLAASSAFDGASVVCLCLEVDLETVEAAARAGHDAGATVILNLSPYARVPRALADLTGILMVNAHEASLFLGGGSQEMPQEMPEPGAGPDEWDRIRQRFVREGLERVIVTLGAHGSVVLDSSAPGGRRVTRIEPTPVTAVDTTGAGDAFTGAVAARLAAGETLADAAAFASVAAALAATRKGTQAAYPEPDEVERLRRAQHLR